MDKATALIVSLGQASVTVYLHSTADDENQLVWVKARIGVSQAISQETTEDSGETIGRVPNTAELDMRRKLRPLTCFEEVVPAWSTTSTQ